MEFLQAQAVSTVLVLAGMIDKPEVKDTFACSASFRIDMEALGLTSDVMNPAQVPSA